MYSMRRLIGLMAMAVLMAACDGPAQQQAPTESGTSPVAEPASSGSNPTAYREADGKNAAAGSPEELAALFEAQQLRFKETLAAADERFRAAQLQCETMEGEAREICENTAAAAHEADTTAARIWLDEALTELLKSE